MTPCRFTVDTVLYLLQYEAGSYHFSCLEVFLIGPVCLLFFRMLSIPCWNLLLDLYCLVKCCGWGNKHQSTYFLVLLGKDVRKPDFMNWSAGLKEKPSFMWRLIFRSPDGRLLEWPQSFVHTSVTHGPDSKKVTEAKHLFPQAALVLNHCKFILSLPSLSSRLPLRQFRLRLNCHSGLLQRQVSAHARIRVCLN